MKDNYYLVDVRCGTCGVIFATSSEPLRKDKAEEMSNLFKALGPHKYVQCKNKCPRQDQRPGAIIIPESPNKPPKNMNQIVHMTLVPDQELKERGLMG